MTDFSSGGLVLAHCLTEFNRTFGIPTPTQPTSDIPAETIALRVRLVNEEYEEYLDARATGNPHEIAKEAADLAYVLHGSADAFGLVLDVAPPARRHTAPQAVDVTRVLAAIHARNLEAISVEIADLLTALRATIAADHGIDLDIAVMQVHRSNMSKVGDDGHPIRDEGGKVLKGPNYVPADMTAALLREDVA